MDNDSALKCLVDGGDVAVATYRSVETFFNQPKYYNERKNFNFLCPDNTRMPINSPCPWLKQPWDLLIIGK